MAIKKFRFRPEGVNDYSDILHPETSADVVLLKDTAGNFSSNNVEGALGELYSHLVDKGNPHGVTAAQIGAAPASHVGSGGSAHALATTSVAGFMSAVDKQKLNAMSSPIYQQFTSSGTWTKPSGVTWVLVEVVGAGGGGCSGSRSSGSDIVGGAGGGGGAIVYALILASMLPSSVTVTVGAGGLGAPPTGSGNIQAGNGGSSSFAFIVAEGGQGGARKLDASYGIYTIIPGEGGKFNFMGTDGGIGGDADRTTNGNAPSVPGGAGGGGGAHRYDSTIYGPGTGGTSSILGTSGGNGGTFSTSGNGGKGGNGGIGCGGGGGGGTSKSGADGGAGGNGGNGRVRVWAW